MRLSDLDREMAAGGQGAARQFAFDILLRFAQAVGADSLIDISSAHVEVASITGRSVLISSSGLSPTVGAFARRRRSMSDRWTCCRRTGHIDIVVNVTPDHMMQQHTFNFSSDQTILRPAISAIMSILERFPIRGVQPKRSERKGWAAYFWSVIERLTPRRPSTL